MSIKHGMIKGLFSNNALQGPQSLGIRDYLDKTETKNENYRKVALYLEFAQGGLNESIKIYDVKDN